MSFATDAAEMSRCRDVEMSRCRDVEMSRCRDVEMSSVREILFHCRGQLSVEIRKEASRSQPDAQRLADLELVMSQLRDEIDSVTAGNCTVTARVRLLYGMLIKAAYAPASQ
jgi:hypothetical protein